MYDPFVTLGAVAAVTSKILGFPPTPEYIDILMKYEVDRMILNIPNDSAAAAPDQLDACSINFPWQLLSIQLYHRIFI